MHPNANEFLQRDLSTVTQFFANRGIYTLKTSEAEEFVVEPSRSGAEVLEDNEDRDYEGEEAEDSKKTSNWRNIASNWDETSDMEALLKRLKLK